MGTSYKYWTRDDLFYYLSKQAEDFGISKDLVFKSVFDYTWSPMQDFNGCNFVQDDYHPFLPCFIHDWRWIAFPYTKNWDIEFRDNLIKFGYPKWKARLYYIMVRCGWFFYYKWK